jgi:hypothetical protein
VGGSISRLAQVPNKKAARRVSGGKADPPIPVEEPHAVHAHIGLARLQRVQQGARVRVPHLRGRQRP